MHTFAPKKNVAHIIQRKSKKKRNKRESKNNRNDKRNEEAKLEEPEIQTRGFYRRELGLLRATRLVDHAIEAGGDRSEKHLIPNAQTAYRYSRAYEYTDVHGIAEV